MEISAHRPKKFPPQRCTITSRRTGCRRVPYERQSHTWAMNYILLALYSGTAKEPLQGRKVASARPRAARTCERFVAAFVGCCRRRTQPPKKAASSRLSAAADPPYTIAIHSTLDSKPPAWPMRSCRRIRCSFCPLGAPLLPHKRYRRLRIDRVLIKTLNLSHCAMGDRQTFHIMPEDGWINDPNGPLLFGDTYHL
jgi:hypothetical protein